MARRLARLNEQIKREISEIIRRDVRDPRVGLPTVTDVRVTENLFLARVHVRPDPTVEEGEGADFLEGLEAAAPFIRRELGKIMTSRRVPELRFMEDRALEHARRIETILREVLPVRDGGEGPGEDDGGGPGGEAEFPGDDGPPGEGTP